MCVCMFASAPAEAVKGSCSDCLYSPPLNPFPSNPLFKVALGEFVCVNPQMSPKVLRPPPPAPLPAPPSPNPLASLSLYCCYRFSAILVFFFSCLHWLRAAAVDALQA